MKVVHVITGLRIGGAENQLRILLRHSRANAEVIALTNADEVADAIRQDGTPVRALDMRGNREVLAVFKLARWIRQQRPDVVHLHLYRATIYGRLAAWLARVPVVVTTEHSLLDGFIEGRPTTKWIRGLYVATERLNTATIAVSREVYARLAKWGVKKRKLHVVPNGIELVERQDAGHAREKLRRELGWTEATQVIAGIGRLAPEKRWDLLIESTAPLLGPGRRLALIGAGAEELRLRDLARSIGVDDFVTFLGARSDVNDVLAAVDVVASTSPQETFGLAVLEAVLAGCPVVYVRAPAVDEIGSLPGAIRVAGEVDAIRAGLLKGLQLNSRVPMTEALKVYDIRNVASQVDDLYATLRHEKGML